jgi:hypothetical protein
MEAITGILTPPGNFESFLDGAYPAFIRLVGYIRARFPIGGLGAQRNGSSTRCRDMTAAEADSICQGTLILRLYIVAAREGVLQPTSRTIWAIIYPSNNNGRRYDTVLSSRIADFTYFL